MNKTEFEQYLEYHSEYKKEWNACKGKNVVLNKDQYDEAVAVVVGMESTNGGLIVTAKDMSICGAWHYSDVETEDYIDKTLISNLRFVRYISSVSNWELL